MRDEAARLANLPGFAGMNDERLASLLVGRWPSGAPVNRVPAKDNPDLGRDAQSNNHFRFDSDSHLIPLADGSSDPFNMATADPAGIVCPWAAHIRKLNTRDSGSDLGGRDSTFLRRILRLGIPFGEPLANRYEDPASNPKADSRGLLFLCAQASIEDQFEFLVSRWANDPSRPKMPGGHDLVIGQNASDPERARSCTIFGTNFAQAKVAVSKEWVIPTGGGYFFVPSLSALRTVISAENDAPEIAPHD
jgi:deferrochelatase/peroxidase EfeB